MDSNFIKNKRNTLMVAHRGLSGKETENTLLSFVAAGNRSYYGIECDVHVTKDGKYVIFHDDSTGRICENDVKIEESDFEKLRSLEFKKSDCSECLKIPTLAEYLSVCRRYGKVAVIELKNPMKKENLCEILEISKREYDLDKIIFISFCFDNLIKIRECEPMQTVQFLCCEYSEELLKNLVTQKFDLDILHSALTEQNVSALHSAGIKINCWTCDEKFDAERLISLGVDFITTNVLE